MRVVSKSSLVILIFMGAFMVVKPATAQVNVTVDPAAVIANLKSSPLGLSLNQMNDGTLSLDSLKAAVISSGSKRLRFPEGESADNYYFTDPSTLANPNPATHRIANTAWWPANSSIAAANGAMSANALNFDQFMSVVNSAGAVPNVVLCYPCTDKVKALAMAKAWVKYSKDMGYNVLNWEIGNETYLYNPNYTDLYAMTPAEYAKDVIEWSAALKAIDPRIKIGMNGNDWVTSLLTYKHPTLGTYGAQAVDFIVVHSYPIYHSTFSNYQNNQSAYGTLDFSADVRKAVSLISAASATINTSHIRIAVTECGSLSFLSGDYNNLGSALMTADLMSEMLKQPIVDYVELWAARWLNNFSDPMPQSEDAFSRTNKLQATGLALAILARFTQDRALAISGATTSLHIFASSSSTSGQVNVQLINRSNSSQTINLTVKGASGLIGKRFSITGSSPTDTNPVYDATGISINSSSSSIALTLPPTSIIVMSFDGAPPPIDIQAPTAPQNFSASAVSTSQIALAWSASSDNTGVTGYKIFRNGSLLAQVSQLNFTDIGLLASTAYSYQVSAIDAAGNESAKSVVASTTTLSGPPPPPADLIVNSSFEVSALSGWVNWGNSSAVAGNANSGSFSARTGTAAGGLAQDVASKLIAGKSYRLEASAKLGSSTEMAWIGVKIYNSLGAVILSVSAKVTSTSYSVYTIDFIAPADAAVAHVWAWKDAGAGSYLYLDDVILKELGAIPPPITSDTIAPTVIVTSPTGGTAFARRTTVTLNATATDNVGVTEVQFMVDGQVLCTDTIAPYSCSWHTPRRSGTHNIQVKAKDAAGNVGSTNVISVRVN